MMVHNELCALDFIQAKCVDMSVKNMDSHILVPNYSSKCKMCNTNSPEIKPSITTSKAANDQPYYLCTVTCCNSANCMQASNVALAKSISPRPANLYEYNCISCPVTPEPSSTVPLLNDTNCTICAKVQHAKSRIILPNLGPNRELELSNKVEYLNQTDSASQSVIINSKSAPQSQVNLNINGKNEHCVVPAKRVNRKESLNRNAKLQIYMANDKNRIQSPELSSSTQGNSSYTEYTDTYTPVCTSANSNPTETNHFKFSVEGKPSPLNSDYQFYFAANVDNHGFFRKAVPALPVAVAVLLCILNLVLPGSGIGSIAQSIGHVRGDIIWHG